MIQGRGVSDLHKQFLNKINIDIRNRVQFMFEEDQKIAFRASQIEDEEEQEAFISKKFTKHSEEQIKKLLQIIIKNGYPGEFLIGNDFWSSTILSHHNSISPNFVRNDTLYDFIKPKLLQSLDRGYISPYEFALMEDWKKAVISDLDETIYGYVNEVDK